MKTKILIICLLASIKCYSQTLVDKKDDFTGKPIKAATVNFLSKYVLLSGTYEMLTISESDGQKHISMVISLPSGRFGVFGDVDITKTSLLFKMPNDTLIRFKADPVNSKIQNGGNNSMLAITADITDAQINYFALNKISAFRVALVDTDAGLDIQMSEGKRKQIIKSAAFMLGMTYFEDAETEN